MHMIKKRTLAFVAALVFVFAFTACVETNSSARSTEKNSARTAKARGKQSDEVKLTHKIIQKGQPGADAVTLTFGVTGDVHGRLYAYDYAVCEETAGAGFVKTYVLAKELRAQNPNTVLIDVGDTVQDNSADLFNDLDTHPMIQALNYMNYDI